MKTRASLWLLALLLAGPPTLRGAETSAAPADAELRVRILGGESRQPVPCTVTLVDARGQTVTRSGAFRGGFHCPGVFTNLLPSGPATIRVTRGPEYKAVQTRIDLRAGQSSALELVLERQVDLRKRGWFAGDSHAHMIHQERLVAVDFDQVALAAQAADLQYLSLAQAWALDNPTPERLDTELARRSTPDCFLAWNLEAPKNYYKGDAARCLGHCWTLAMRGRLPDGADVIPVLQGASAMDYESQKPSFANFESHALVRAQGGSVFYTHPARWWTGSWGGQGGYPKQEKTRVSNMAVELPLDVLAGPTFDGLDVITGAGEAAADQKAFQLWALLLNHGRRLAATASSDACFDRPGDAGPGAARLYTFVEGPFSIAAAAQAAARGRTFATTGPLVLASVDRQPPGSSFPANGSARELRVEAWASGATSGGLARVEILRNGTLFREFRLDGRQPSLQTNLSLVESESAWYCVRVFGASEQRQRAITGAFYFDKTPWQPPAPVPARARIRVLDAVSGRALDATLTEIAFHGTQTRPGPQHRLPGGTVTLTFPATHRLRAEAPGYAPVTLSPFFDNPPLLELITALDDRSMLDWHTYERIQTLLGDFTLTFNLSRDPSASNPNAP